MARWFIEFEAIDPANVDRRWKTGIHEWLYRRLQHSGHEKALARLLLVNDVLSGGTTHIYRGWSRRGKDECFVYAGHPGRDFKSLSIETPAPKGMVFLVFILGDGTIDEWTWRPLAEDEEDRPQGVTGELIWSQNPS